MKFGALLALVFLAASGCSSGDGADGAELGAVSESPAAVVTSDTGGYTVSVHSAPDAMPTRGVNTLRLDVTRVADGAPVSGLELDVVPWMPAHGHGASVKPTVAPGSVPGSYTVSNVALFMPGLWEIRTTIGGGAGGHDAPQFDVR
jgi:hypothetical protein